MTDEIRTFVGEYSFLSNFYDSAVTIDGKHFSTSEHAFQAYKTLDGEWFENIRTARSAGVAKRLGREAPLRKDWENIKDEIMLKCLRAKFGNPELKQMLLDTGDAQLVEGNDWHDGYWGVCRCSKHGGKGKNMLGRLLMQVRQELNHDV